MQYQMQYNVCAIVICFVILFTHLMRKKTKEYHNIIFTLIVLSTLIGAFNNILNTVGNMDKRVIISGTNNKHLTGIDRLVTLFLIMVTAYNANRNGGKFKLKKYR